MRKHIIPLKGGEAVYHARTLYALINDSMEYDDENICTAMGYRLKQKETNNGLVAMEVSPNPAKNYFEFTLLGKVENDMALKYFDSYGKHLKSIKINQGENNHIISTENLVNGVYHLVLYDDKNEVSCIKLVIIK